MFGSVPDRKQTNTHLSDRPLAKPLCKQRGVAEAGGLASLAEANADPQTRTHGCCGCELGNPRLHADTCGSSSGSAHRGHPGAPAPPRVVGCSPPPWRDCSWAGAVMSSLSRPSSALCSRSPAESMRAWGRGGGRDGDPETGAGREWVRGALSAPWWPCRQTWGPELSAWRETARGAGGLHLLGQFRGESCPSGRPEPRRSPNMHRLPRRLSRVLLNAGCCLKPLERGKVCFCSSRRFYEKGQSLPLEHTCPL